MKTKSKLSSEEKLKVAKLYSEKKSTQAALADTFGVSRSSISRAIKWVEINADVLSKESPAAKKSPAPKKDIGQFDENDFVFNTKTNTQQRVISYKGNDVYSVSVNLDSTDTVDVNGLDLIYQNIVNEQSILIVHNGQPKVIASGHHNYAEVKELISKKMWRKVVSKMDEKFALERYSNGRVEIKNGKVFLDGEQVHLTIVSRIVAMLDTTYPGEENNLKGITNFLVNLLENPSYRAVNELYGFLEHNDIEITEDGHFYAWKAISPQYKDKHSGKIDNSIGSVVSVPRNKVDENSERTCSYGLHVCAQAYLSSYASYGDPIVKCKVHPRDVVAIPRDYNNSKMRVCRYVVEEEVSKSGVKK